LETCLLCTFYFGSEKNHSKIIQIYFYVFYLYYMRPCQLLTWFSLAIREQKKKVAPYFWNGEGLGHQLTIHPTNLWTTFTVLSLYFNMNWAISWRDINFLMWQVFLILINVCFSRKRNCIVFRILCSPTLVLY
jgi:hypothetical protein